MTDTKICGYFEFYVENQAVGKGTKISSKDIFAFNEPFLLETDFA